MPKRGRGRGRGRGGGGGGRPSKRSGVDEPEDAKKVKQNESSVNSDLDDEQPGPGPSSQIIEAKVVEDFGAVPAVDEAVELKLSHTDLLTAQGALSNHLVLKEIFKYLPVPDLLALSLVNNFWNSCARTVLRGHKKCFAYISRERMCKDLKQLDTLLGESVNPPFNGIGILSATSPEDILCAHKAFHNDSTLENRQAFYMNLLDTDKLNCEYLSLKLWTWGLSKDGDDKKMLCPGQAILQDLIVKSAPTLKGLSVTDVTHYVRATKSLSSVTLDELFGFKEADQDFIFPKLKFLEVPEKLCGFDCKDDYCFASRLLQTAPNVEIVTGGLRWIHLNYLEEENKLGAVRELDIELNVDDDHLDEVDEEEDSDISSDVEDEDEDVDPVKKEEEEEIEIEKDEQTRVGERFDVYRSLSFLEPKLTKISISTFHYKSKFGENPGKWFPKLFDIYTDLLSSSVDSLEEIKIAHLDLILLSRLQLKPLRRVHTVTIYFYNHNLTWALTGFDYSKLFPSLNSVIIKSELSMEGFGKSYQKEAKKWEDLYITEQMYARETEEFMWPLVTNLRYEDAVPYYRFRKENQFDVNLAKLFPNIKTVVFDKYDLLANACTIMWTHWPKLESVTFLSVADVSIYKCQDHVFAGILMTKCPVVRSAILKGEDVNELIDKFQTKPSIRNLTKLKKFRVEFNHEDTCKRLPESSVYGPPYVDPQYNDNYHTFKLVKKAKLKYDGLFLSEVTTKCALDLMPDLTFEIKGSTCNIPGTLCCFGVGLEQLQPNVKLFIKKKSLKISL